jgi:hypothetical protein
VPYNCKALDAQRVNQIDGILREGDAAPIADGLLR